MIYIYNYQNNSVPFTLNEKRILDNSNFILQLYSNNNKVSDLFWLTGDTSPNPNRWNEFTLSAQTVSSLEAGTYDYFCLETTGTTLNISQGFNVCESGKAVVIGTGTTIPTLINTENQYTYL
jgi:hypothetical protein